MIAWEIARTSAFVAFGAYTLSVAWGITIAARAFRAPVKAELDFHRFISAVGLIALLVHIATVLVSHANHTSWEVLLLVRAKPAAVAGVAAFWLSILLPLSFRLKGRKLMTAATWRALHYLGYLVWVLALLHGLGAGSDTRSTLALAGYAGAAAIVAGAFTWRLTARVAAAPARRARVADAPAAVPPSERRRPAEPGLAGADA